MQFVESATWFQAQGYRVSHHLGVDGLSLFLILLTTFITPLAILSSWHTVERGIKGYMICLLTLETGMVGVFTSLDLVLFYVFWEVMLIPMYFLIGVWGGERRIYAAVKFILYTMAGSLLMLIAILYLFLANGGSHLSICSRSRATWRRARSGSRREKTSGSSWPFSLHSRSRCRSSPFTPGFPTLTSKRPRPAR